jgi:hypothetical protein
MKTHEKVFLYELTKSHVSLNSLQLTQLLETVVTTDADADARWAAI